MKYKNLVLILLFILCGGVLQAQNTVFDKLSSRKDIQAVHVSKSLLEMMPKVETGGVDISDLASKLKQIDVYTSESVDAVKFMKAQATAFEKDEAYETFMAIKEQDQKVFFYGKQTGGTFKDLIMIAEEKGKCTIVRMLGEFTAKDIQAIIKK